MSRSALYFGFRVNQAYLYFLSTLLLLIVFTGRLKAQDGHDMANAINAGTFGFCGESSFNQYVTTNSSGFTNYYGQAGPDAWYKFTVTGNYADMNINTCSTDFDTYLHLLDANGSEISSNDNAANGCGNGVGSSIQYSALPPGTYYVVVDGTGSTNTGTAEVSIFSSTNYTSNAPGNGMANAINAGTFDGSGSFMDTKDVANSCLSNQIGYPGNDVYYKFTLTKEATVTLSHCGSGFDTYLLLLNSAGEIWATDDDNAGTACPGLEAYIQVKLSPGTYYLVSDAKYNYTGNLVSTISVSPDDCPYIRAMPSSDQNYLLTFIPRISITNDLYLANETVCNVNESIDYFDGLGRPLQTVQAKASPDKNKDIVLPHQYDEFGREAKTFLPYANNNSVTGSYKADALQNGAGIAAFYNAPPSGVTQIANPYSETNFEPSPLNKVSQQAFPGTAFSLSSGHTVKTVYDSNITGEVQLWTLTTGGAVTTANYDPGTLYKTITKDENWTSGKSGTTEEFKDKKGKVIVKRIWDTESSALSTYYIYDDFGNLSYVIPPGFTPTTLTEDATVNDTPFDQFVYAYHYDQRNRLVEKKIPGKGWEYMIYDKLDQVVATQDANQRSSNQWVFTKYDVLGRVVLSGIYINGGSRSTVQGVADGITTYWESRGSNTTYSSVAFPTTVTSLLTVNYYDDYTFNTDPTYNFNTSQVYGLSSTQSTKGLLTGSLVNILGGSQFLKTVSYYDNNARVVQTISQNHLSGTDRVDNQYDFIGELVGSTTTHSSSTDNVIIANRYEYDHMGRKLRTYQKTGPANINNSEIILSERIYNDIGQLKDKRLHSSSGSSANYQTDVTLDDAQNVNSGQERHITASNSITLLPNFEAKAGSVFTAAIQNGALQEIHYTYNSRGWLKTITSGQFSEELKYEDGTTPQYNGNIANQLWGISAANVNTFTYTYDKVNRLTNGSATGMSEALTYDVMGNIHSMSRDGAAASTYQYFGNRLDQITGGSLATAQYLYDVNGNATTDGRNNKNISYNLLNLPQTVSGGLSYIYDANGRKLKKQSGSTTIDYIGGIQYKNGIIEFIQTEEGIARKVGTNYSYEYNLTDHLGNSRATFYKNPNTQVLEVLQRDDYYPYGKQNSVLAYTNKYLYNGKELQDELGQYDYGARFYDPEIGRWGHIDPKAELYFQINPYAYAANTPVNAVDPDGHLVIFINGQHGSGETGHRYWSEPGFSFDSQVQKHFNDMAPARYYDGALGGWSNTLSLFFNKRNNLFLQDRIDAGHEQGQIDAEAIINSLQHSGGVITESIKIIAHSMGAAYAKGLIHAILEYAKEHPNETRGLSITEYDFAAYQQNKLSAIPGVKLYQYDNLWDEVIVNGPGSERGKIKGREEKGSIDEVNPEGGHSIFDFKRAIKKLPIGKYNVVNGEFVKTDNDTEFTKKYKKEIGDQNR